MNICSWGQLGGALMFAAAMLAANTDAGGGDAPATLAAAPRGDAVNGQQLFHSTRASCSDCHEVSVGESGYYPNLSTVGRRLTRQQLETAIVEPSTEFATGYKSVTVMIDSGRIIRGVEIESQSNARTLVLTNDAGKQISIERGDIVELQIAESDMPSNLTETLSRQEIADIIAYLQSLR